MKAFLKKLMTNWVMKNYPFKVTTRVIRVLYIKKGKIRECRAYDEDNNRILMDID